MSQDSDRGYDRSPAENGTASRADTLPVVKTSHRAASYDRGVQIAAARLRLVTDSQLGLNTPDWVKELATSLRIPGDRTAGDRDFWEKNSGIKVTPQGVTKAAVSDVAARSQMESSALTTEMVAAQMSVPASAVLQFRADRNLYSYPANGPVFPKWQFTATGDAVIPSLGSVLAALPDDLHPQTVAGFFLTPQPDLVIDGVAVSAKEWLEAGMPAERVVQLATELAAAC